ncbi:uncharacterized protein LOC106153614 [Lingula anatina]|uniref:Uncharacterized protein LOC106153614 n=1 Tax=Lingula anatina TaxID=7574 RepID=A0A1S3HAN2_LINAN|nr:uncharacterized protein LOC106153614 [Lingula anatina]|eukprot:XP_013383063.1 uncharacterized protein LOC106153614 [Lingula anatina]
MKPKLYSVSIVPCIFIEVAFILITIGLGTDSWYWVTSGDHPVAERPEHNMKYGLWRTCFTDWPTGPFARLSLAPPYEVCVSSLTKRTNSSTDSSVKNTLEEINLFVSIAVISSAALLLLAVVVCSIGFWKELVSETKTVVIAASTGGLAVLGGLLEAAALICFIALRDLERQNSLLPATVYRGWGWSFMVSWAGVGMALIGGFAFFYMAYLMKLERKYTYVSKQNGKSDDKYGLSMQGY